MSSEVIARVYALSQKADELDQKGHLLCAAEYYARAAEAARTLDPGADNLVTLDMLRQQADAVLTFTFFMSRTAVTANSGTLAAHRSEAIALLSAITDGLQRRRVAGTLLMGSAAEEACAAEHLRNSGSSPAEVGCLKKCRGYTAYIWTARAVLVVLIAQSLFVRECSASQFESFAQFVVHAMEMLELPRSHSSAAFTYFQSDLRFAEKLAKSMPLLETSGSEPRLVRLVTDAWQHLQHNGVPAYLARLEAPKTQKTESG